jgi:hypothetical protein
MTTSDWLTVLNGIAILLAPIVALRVGAALQNRSDARKAKLEIFSTLISLRHVPTSDDIFRALNLIYVVFVGEPAVREAWTRYFSALEDPRFYHGVGPSIVEEKRRDLLLEIVKALKLSRKITSADLLRTYTPKIVGEDLRLAMLERLRKRAVLEEELKQRRIQFPPSQLSQEAYPAPAPAPPTGPSAGDAAERPHSV